MGYFDGPGALSGFHWGLGSAMASVEMVWERYGDVFVDLEHEYACGVNGCAAKWVSRTGNSVAIAVETEIEWQTPMRAVFRGAPGGRIGVVVNGSHAGIFSESELERGVTFAAPNAEIA